MTSVGGTHKRWMLHTIYIYSITTFSGIIQQRYLRRQLTQIVLWCWTLLNCISSVQWSSDSGGLKWTAAQRNRIWCELMAFVHAAYLQVGVACWVFSCTFWSYKLDPFWEQPTQQLKSDSSVKLGMLPQKKKKESLKEVFSLLCLVLLEQDHFLYSITICLFQTERRFFLGMSSIHKSSSLTKTRLKKILPKKHALCNTKHVPWPEDKRWFKQRTKETADMSVSVRTDVRWVEKTVYVERLALMVQWTKISSKSSHF